MFYFQELMDYLTVYFVHLIHNSPVPNLMNDTHRYTCSDSTYIYIQVYVTPVNMDKSMSGCAAHLQSDWLILYGSSFRQARCLCLYSILGCCYATSVESLP